MGHAKSETTARYDKRRLEEHGVRRRTWNIWRPPLTPKPIDVSPKSVGLDEIIRGHGYQAYSGRFDVLTKWIDAGDLVIEAVDLASFASEPRLRVYMAQARKADGCNAGEDHQMLCALAALYIESLKRPFSFTRVDCCYAGGIADVCALDQSLYVECGNLAHTMRVFDAIQSRQTLMIIPYEQGNDRVVGYIFRAETDAPRLALDKEIADALAGVNIFRSTKAGAAK
jgi:hypothetical protein